MPVRPIHLAQFATIALFASSFSVLAIADANDSVPPTPKTLLALDRQTIEAFFDGDSERYGQFLSDSFVMYESGYRLGKADAISVVGSIKCQSQGGWELRLPQVMPVTDGVYVLTYERALDGTCTVAGNTSAFPTPVRAATLWVRTGDTWRAAYHGENVVVNLSASAASSVELDTAANDRLEEQTPGTTISASVTFEDMALTEALLAVETSVWETWRDHDAKALGKLTAGEISFVNIFGDYFANKADTIKNWTGPFCDVDSIELSGGKASLVTPSVGILTVKGTVTGNCGGQDIGLLEVYATTVYAKVTGEWKWTFGFNSQ
jgi:hypothetical protein